MRKAVLEYRLEQMESMIRTMNEQLRFLSEVVDRLKGEDGILNRLDIRISALEANAGIVSITKNDK